MSKNKSIVIFIILFFALSGCENATKIQTAGEKLVVSNKCKPLENKCEILGEGIKLNLQFKAPASYQRLLPITLESVNGSVDKVSMTLIIDGKEMPLEEMKMVGDEQHWEVQLMPFAEVTKDNLKIRLIVMYKAKKHVAEFFVVY